MISLETLVESTWQDGYQLWQLNALQSQPKTNIWKIGNSSKNFGECDDLMTCIVQASWIAELHASTLLESKFQAKYEWRSIFGLGICKVVQIWSTVVPYVCWRNAAGAEMDPSAFAGCLQCSITGQSPKWLYVNISQSNYAWTNILHPSPILSVAHYNTILCQYHS